MDPDPKALEKLWQDTRVPPPEMVQHVDKGAFKADAVGHADATDLLLQHDPLFTWTPMARDEHGNPVLTVDVNGNPALWIWLTVHGLTKPGVGTCLKTAKEPLKELIGDAIRNAAMRFGLALTLWSKTERAETESPGRGSAAKPRGAAKAGKAGSPAPPSPPAAAPGLDQQRAELYSKVKSLAPAEIETLKGWLGEQGIGLDFSAHTVEEIDKIEAELVTSYNEPF